MKLTILIICVAGVLAIVPFFQLLNYICKRRNRLTAADVAGYIERHINDTAGKWDWDDFTSITIADDQLDRIRLSCIESETDVEKLQQILERLRKIEQ